jgi:hypothetical protein
VQPQQVQAQPLEVRQVRADGPLMVCADGLEIGVIPVERRIVTEPSKGTMAPVGAGAPRVGLRRVTRFNSNFRPVSVWPMMVWPSQTPRYTWSMTTLSASSRASAGVLASVLGDFWMMVFPSQPSPGRPPAKNIVRNAP